LAVGGRAVSYAGSGRGHVGNKAGRGGYRGADPISWVDGGSHAAGDEMAVGHRERMRVWAEVRAEGMKG